MFTIVNLEGQEHLVSRLITVTPMSHRITLMIPIIYLCTKTFRLSK